MGISDSVQYLRGRHVAMFGLPLSHQTVHHTLDGCGRSKVRESNASGLLPKMRRENGEVPVTIDTLCGIIFGIVPAVLGSIFLLTTKENDAVSNPVADAIQKELEERVLSKCKPRDPDTLWFGEPSEFANKQFEYLNRRSKIRQFGNCPNCGAPVSGGQCCEYCGTYYET